MRVLSLIQPQNRVDFLEMKTCKMRKKTKVMRLLDFITIASMVMIIFGMFSSVTNAEEIEKIVQPENIEAGSEIPASGK